MFDTLEHPEVKTLFLIDPIDGDRKSHCGTPKYPSAVAALRNHNLKVAMTGRESVLSCFKVDLL